MQFIRPILVLLGAATGAAVLSLTSAIAASAAAIDAGPVSATATAVCGTLPAGTTTWNAAGSPYNICPGGVTVPTGATLVVDGAGGAVNVHATGYYGSITVSGGTLNTANTSSVNKVVFDGPSATVGSYSGLTVISSGTANLAFVTIRYASTAIYVSQVSPVAVTDSQIEQVGTGIYSNAGPITVTRTTVTNTSSGAGIDVNYADLTVDSSNVTNTRYSGVRVCCGGGKTVRIVNSTVDTAGAYGIYVWGADNLTVTGNTIQRSGTGRADGNLYPAMYIGNATVRLGPSAQPTVDNDQGDSSNGYNALHMMDVTILNDWTWRNPAAGTLAPLGYVAQGILTMNAPVAGKMTLTFPAGSVVKSGGFNLNGVTVDARGTGSVFTATWDNSVGIRNCPSALSSTCSVYPGSWGGFSLGTSNGFKSDGSFNGGRITYAGTGLYINSQAGSSLADPSHGLSVVDTVIGTGSTGITAYTTPAVFRGTAPGAAQVNNMNGDALYSYNGVFDVDTVSVSNAGGNGAVASYAAVTIKSSQFTDIGGNGIEVSATAGKAVSINNNQVTRASGYGIHVSYSDVLDLTGNTVTGSGAGAVGSSIYPAIRLDSSRITIDGASSPTMKNNVASGGGLDAFAFVSTTVTNSFTWQNNYLVWGDLNVSAPTSSPITLTMPAGSIAKFLNGGLSLNGAILDASAGTSTFTSLRDNSVGLLTCPSVLVPSSDSQCQTPPAAGDWGGIHIHAYNGALGSGNLTNATLAYAGVDIDSRATTTVGGGTYGLVLSGTSIGSGASDGVRAYGTNVSITGSALMPASINNVAGRGIQGYDAGLTVDTVNITNTGAEGIRAESTTSRAVSLTGNTITGATGAGISVYNSQNLNVSGNIVASSGVSRIGSQIVPAIAIEYSTFSIDGAAPTLTANTGNDNGQDAIALINSTVTNGFTWVTPSPQSAAPGPLGYFGVRGLTLQSPGATPNVVTLPAGAILKMIGGTLLLAGSSLDGTAGGATLTSGKDNSVGMALCPNIWLQSADSLCNTPAAPGDWNGVYMSGGPAGAKGSGSLQRGTLKFAETGIRIDSGATSTVGGGTFGLVLVDPNLDSLRGTAISSWSSSVSVTKTALGTAVISHAGVHGIEIGNADLTVDGISLSDIGATGINVSSATGRAINIANNQVTSAHQFGIQVASADNLTLRANTVTSSGNAPAGRDRYPAYNLYSSTITFDAAAGPTVTGNQAANDGIPVLLLSYVTVKNGFTWVSPQASATPTPVGYAVGSTGLTVDAAAATSPLTLTVPASAVVKSMGRITLYGVNLDAQAGSAVFTSARDNSVGVSMCPSTMYPSSTGVCGSSPAAGDWGGILTNASSGGAKGGVNLTNATLRYADTGVYMSSGATAAPGAASFGLVFSGTISSVSNGISSSQSPVSLTNVTVDGANNEAITVTNASTAQSNTITAVTIRNAGAQGLTLSGNGTSSITNFKATGVGGSGLNNYALRVFSPYGASISCSTITGNAGGLSTSTAATTIANSNLYGNAAPGRYDLANNSSSGTVDARNNYWGAATGPAAQQTSGSVTTSPFLTAPPACAPA